MASFSKDPTENSFSHHFTNTFLNTILVGRHEKDVDILKSLWKKTNVVATTPPQLPTPFPGPEHGLWVSNIPMGMGPISKPLPGKGC